MKFVMADGADSGVVLGQLPIAVRGLKNGLRHSHVMSGFSVAGDRPTVRFSVCDFSGLVQ